MPQPIDYLSMIQQPRISQSANDLAVIIGQRRAEKDAQEKESELAAQYSKDLQETFNNPRPEAFAALIAKYPQQREAFKDTWGILDKAQQDAEFGEAAEVYSALEYNPEIAKSIVDKRIVAMQNSGEDASHLEQIRVMLDRNPAVVKNQLAFTLSSIDPDKWVKMSGELRDRTKAPYELTEAQAKAQKAAVESNFAESQAAADLTKKGWEIAKLQADVDVAKENKRIAAIDAAYKKTENEEKKLDLEQKRKDAEVKRDNTIREKTAALEGSRAVIDNSLNTIDRLLKNPELNNVVGSLEGSAFYPSTMMAILNPAADADKRADATADIETVQGQQFLDNLMAAKQNGATFGALTDKEGAKLEGYIRSLKTKQSEGQFRDNLYEIQRILLKSRKILSEKHGVPETIPDTPNAAPEPSEVDAILLQYGVK